MRPPVFLSGPQGSGKTTLLEKLCSKYELFYENDFDIDSIKEFPSIKVMSHFERCLLRLYHRIYLTDYATLLSEKHPDKVILTSRGIKDSEAYIKAYKDFDWISDDCYSTLEFVLNNFRYKPYTIILNPPFEVVKQRLENRRKQGVRILRDELFSHEDTDDFLKSICMHFEQFKNTERVLYLENNEEDDIKKIFDWLDGLKKVDEPFKPVC